MELLFEYMMKFFKIKFDFGDISISFFDIFMISFMLRFVFWLITFKWSMFSDESTKVDDSIAKDNYIVDKKTGEILNP